MAENWWLITRLEGFTSEKAMWENLYKTKSVQQLAHYFKVGRTTILRRLNKKGVQKRGPGGASNNAYQAFKLFHLDQRILLGLSEEWVASLIEANPGTVHKFKHKLYRGRKYEVRSSKPD